MDAGSGAELELTLLDPYHNPEENCSLSRTSHQLAVVTASGAQKNKLSLQRHSSRSMLSFDAEVEELNIATRADTMMTTLSPPSSCSIANGIIW